MRLALDGACIALAEHWRGAAVGARNALAMVVSTGSRRRPGRRRRRRSTEHSGNAGHIGQLRLRDRAAGAPATDGTRRGGRVRVRARSPGRAAGVVGNTGEEIAERLRRRRPDRGRRGAALSRAVGQAIADVATLLDLEVAVIAGGFARVSDDCLDLVRSAAQDAAVLGYARRVRIEPSGLHGDGPLIGAAALIPPPNIEPGRRRVH